MELLSIIIFLIILICIASAFGGNVVIIFFLATGDNFYIKESAFPIFCAVIADIILIRLAIQNWGDSMLDSFRLAKKGIKNHIKARKQSAYIKNNTQNITESINRLEKLRAMNINRADTMRAYHLCQLLTDISDKEQLQECFNVIDEKKKVLIEMETIEQYILQLAEKYKDVGNSNGRVYSRVETKEEYQEESIPTIQ